MAPIRAAVRGLDSLLRRCYGIHEFSFDPDCILRVGLGRAPRDLILSDGAAIREGDPVADIHLWNERIPVMPPGGPGLRWGIEFQRKARRSLQLLVEYVDKEPRYRHVVAFRAIGSLMSQEASAAQPLSGAATLITAVPAVAGRLGLEIVDVDDPSRMGALRRFGAFWENGFNQALVWAYNPPSLKSRSLARLRRVQLWASRDKLAGRARSGGPSRRGDRGQSGRVEL